MFRRAVRAFRALDGRGRLEVGLLVVGFALLFFVLPHGLDGDDSVRYQDIEQLIHHGHLTSSQYSLLGPLLSSPLLLLGEVVKSPMWWAARFNVLVVLGGLSAAFVLTRSVVEHTLFRRFAIVVLFASFLTDRLHDYAPEVLTGTLVALGSFLVVRERHSVVGWGLMVVGVINTPATIGGLALIALWRASQQRRFRPLLAPVAAGVLIGAEAWLRRGSPFTTGYEGNHGVATILPYSGRAGFSYPFLLGIVSILFSFGRGLLFFTPGLILWFSSRTRRVVGANALTTAWLLFLAGLVLVYAKWWAWYGGLTWGPRFFVFAVVPASLFLAARLQPRERSAGGAAITLGVLALSSWVSVTAALENGWRAGFCAQHNYRVEYLCWYTPDYSGLWWPLIHHPPLTASTVVLAVFYLAVFLSLAAPLVRTVVRFLAPLPRRWAYGWRF